MGTHIFDDFLNAYESGNCEECIEVGLELLGKLGDDKSKKLERRLKRVKYSWNMPETQKKKLMKLIDDVKLWLMVNNDGRY